MKQKNKNSGYIFIFYAAVAVMAAVIFSACNQDSIFADIAVEPPPVDPKIKGSPTNLIFLNDEMYVAAVNSKTIHVYSGGGTWRTIAAPDRIGALAASVQNGDLYALAGSDLADMTLYEYDASGVWNPVDKGEADSYRLQSVYGVNGQIFIGASKGSMWSIFYLDAGVLKLLIENTGQLRGAEFDSGNYYIAAYGKGIYETNSLSLIDTETSPPVTGSAGKIMGILNVNTVITEVTYDGKILVYDGAEFILISSVSDYNYTGAMSVWNEWKPDDPQADPVVYTPPVNGSLLLLGVTGSGSYTNGYRELTLDIDGKPLLSADQKTLTPGGALSSVKPDDKNKYEASLARYSVFSIRQIPEDIDDINSNSSAPGAYTEQTGWQPLIFASTVNNGLYVLKDGRWNAQP
ncbi:MAG: hypothetical protein FWD78_16155 [Treponema sp.]|nr:hypothetical protein [Treponema sp.]